MPNILKNYNIQFITQFHNQTIRIFHLNFKNFTIYSVQKIKKIGEQAGDSSEGKKYGIMGALTLYLDFINLFLFLLRLFGGRKD